MLSSVVSCGSDVARAERVARTFRGTAAQRENQYHAFLDQPGDPVPVP